jgi:hypothetical protein
MKELQVIYSNMTDEQKELYDNDFNAFVEEFKGPYEESKKIFTDLTTRL